MRQWEVTRVAVLDSMDLLSERIVTQRQYCDLRLLLKIHALRIVDRRWSKSSGTRRDKTSDSDP